MVNIVLVLLFGVLHQGGVVPSLFYLHDKISSMDVTHSARIVYWKTYMPPLHLLAIDEQGDLKYLQPPLGYLQAIDLSGYIKNRQCYRSRRSADIITV